MLGAEIKNFIFFMLCFRIFIVIIIEINEFIIMDVIDLDTRYELWD